MITLSALTFDPEGVVEIHRLMARPERDITRRVSTAATLDGSAAVNDYGAVDSDRVFDVEWRACGVEDAVRRLLRLHGQVRASTSDGVFVVGLAEYSERNGVARLRMPVIRRVSE